MQQQNETGNLRVTILGTGTSQGIPVIGCQCEVCSSTDSKDKRLRTSVLVQSGETNLLIDAGPDFRQQMLRIGVSRINTILLTHEHNDHISGLDDVRPVNFLQGGEIPVYGLPRVLDAVRRRFDYVFDEGYQYPGLPQLGLHPMVAGEKEIDGVRFHAIDIMHGPLPILGFRFGDFAYITDAKTISDVQIAFLRDLDILVINALHHRPHFSHFNLTEALEMIEKINPRIAYLTHLSHHMGLHKEVEKSLPARVRIAYDGLQIVL